MPKIVKKAIVSLVVATLLYGLYGIYTRIISIMFGPFWLNGLRSLIVVVILGAVLIFMRSWKWPSRKDWPLILFWGVCGFGSIMALIFAFNEVPIGTVLFVYYAGSILGGMLIGGLFFNEKMTRIKLVSMLLCFAGLFFIYSSEFIFEDLLYVWVSFAGGLFASLWYTVSKRFSGRYSAIQLNFIDAGVNLVLSLGLAFLFDERLPIFIWSLPWVFLFIFAMTQILVVPLVVFGFKHLEAQIGSLIMPLEAFFGALLGLVYFHEILPLFTWVGGVLIVAAFALLNFYPEGWNNSRTKS